MLGTLLMVFYITEVPEAPVVPVLVMEAPVVPAVLVRMVVQDMLQIVMVVPAV